MAVKIKQIPIGARFGRLEVISPCFSVVGKRYRFIEVKCDCGVVKTVHKTSLVTGATNSCGCILRETSSKRMTIHGESKNVRLFRIWANMRDRCNRENNRYYMLYGGRGIKICDEWNDYVVFRDWAMSNGYSQSLTLDRIDTDSGYCPKNCRWATKVIQACNRNTPSHNKSGLKGVYKTRNRWVSQIRIDGKLIHLGSFKSKDEAYSVRCKYISDNNLIYYKP